MCFSQRIRQSTIKPIQARDETAGSQRTGPGVGFGAFRRPVPDRDNSGKEREGGKARGQKKMPLLHRFRVPSYLSWREGEKSQEPTGPIKPCQGTGGHESVELQPEDWIGGMARERHGEGVA